MRRDYASLRSLGRQRGCYVPRVVLAIAISLMLTWAALPAARSAPSLQASDVRAIAGDRGRQGSLGRLSTTSPNLELVGQLGGVTHAVAVQGAYAYIGLGARLVVLHIFHPSRPWPCCHVSWRLAGCMVFRWFLHPTNRVQTRR